jgi:hypothetical protein
MTILTSRSGSQILGTFLPEQTADINGRIYQVDEWTAPTPIDIDAELVRHHLLRDIVPWSANNTDSGMAADLHKGVRVEVVELDERRGVAVVPYPKVWLCNVCKRIGKPNADRRACQCGQRKWGQLHFVGIHECGRIYEPWIRRCPAHDDVKLVSPQSAKLSDIKFVCPECNNKIMDGVGFRQCDCGQGPVRWNVHKARMVYTPRGTVLINPPRPERMAELKLYGGARKALIWVVEGLVAHRPQDIQAKMSREEFIADLVARGMDPGVAETLAATAGAAGQFSQPGDLPIDGLPPDRRDAAQREAVDIAMALAESRQPVATLKTSDPTDLLNHRYQTSYPAALARAGLDGLDLVDRFPIVRTMYGYTRGEDDPSKCTLVPFRRKGGGYRLYGALAETEAYLVRLEPLRVARWLSGRGHRLKGWEVGNRDAVAARVAILDAAYIPDRRDDPATPSLGNDLLHLVHTYAHRLIRQTAVFSGIERDSLSEYLLPAHLGFFVYAAARGDFVLGGLQAVFESNLDALLDSFVDAEHRCPLDPGCSRGSGACSACVHLGEPSCRYFNRFLNRTALFGRTGYLRESAP